MKAKVYIGRTCLLRWTNSHFCSDTRVYSVGCIERRISADITEAAAVRCCRNCLLVKYCSLRLYREKTAKLLKFSYFTSVYIYRVNECYRRRVPAHYFWSERLSAGLHHKLQLIICGPNPYASRSCFLLFLFDDHLEYALVVTFL